MASTQNRKRVTPQPSQKRRRGEPSELLKLLVPKTFTFRAQFDEIDQNKVMNSCVKRIGHMKSIPLFHVRRLVFGHIHIPIVKVIAKKIISCSFRHVFGLQNLARRIKRQEPLTTDFDFEESIKKMKKLIERWLRISPRDRKLFRGFCAESVMLGIVATMPESCLP